MIERKGIGDWTQKQVDAFREQIDCTCGTMLSEDAAQTTLRSMATVDGYNVLKLLKAIRTDALQRAMVTDDTNGANKLVGMAGLCNAILSAYKEAVQFTE